MGKLKSPGKSTKVKITMPPFDYVPPTVDELGGSRSKLQATQFVKCKIKSNSLPHLDFEWPAIPTDITLAIIKGAIHKRHGGSTLGLELFRDNVKPSSCLQADESTSLKDVGVIGVVVGSEAEMPTITLFYTYEAVGADDAILLVECNPLNSKYGIDVKLYNTRCRAAVARNALSTGS